MTRRAGGLSAVNRLASHQPDRALAELDEAVARWPQGGVHVQHSYAFQAAVQIALYRGDRRALRATIDAPWRRIDGAWVHRAQTLRITGGWRHACAQLGALGDSVDRLARARVEAQRLRNDGLGWAVALADLVDASIAALEGSDTEASRRLASAIEGCGDSSMQLLAQVARMRLGALVGGTQGAESVGEAKRFFAEQGVTQVRAFANIFVPWP